jgi:hypothetical protein
LWSTCAKFLEKAREENSPRRRHLQHDGDNASILKPNNGATARNNEARRRNIHNHGLDTKMAVDNERIPAIGGCPRHACICGKEECKALLLAFKELGDQRSRFTQLPMTTADGELLKPNDTMLKKQRILRIMHYLRPGEDAYISNEAYDNRKATREQRRTRTMMQGPVRSRKWIALHHFHPSIVRSGIQKGRAGKPDRFVLPAKVSKEFIQSNIPSSSGYRSVHDIAPDKKSFMTVPSYTISEAHADLKAVQERERRNHVIAEYHETRAPTRARRSSTWTKMHDTTLAEAHHANKRTKTSCNNETQRDEVIGALYSVLEEQQRELEEARKAVARVGASVDESAIHYKALTSKIAGVNRASICSEEWHKLHPTQAKDLFGFDTWDETACIIEVNFGLFPPKQSDYTPDGPLTEFEECLLALVWMENDVSLAKLQLYSGGKSIGTVSNVLKKWTPEWGEVGDQMSILPWITADFIDDMEPEKYQKANLRKVGSVVDGKDFGAETVRKNAIITVAQRSSKIEASAFRILTWSLACGLIHERTKGFLSKGSEKAINRLWGAHGRLIIPAGYLLMGDKGFEGTSGFYPNDNPVLFPAFLYGQVFSREQVGWNIQACQLRYTCEVDFSRVTQRKSLYGKLRRAKFTYFEDLVGWAHGRANMYKPLQMPTKYKHMFE